MLYNKMYWSTNFEYNRKLDQHPKTKQKGAGHKVSLCKVHILFFHLVKEKKKKNKKKFNIKFYQLLIGTTGVINSCKKSSGKLY